MATAESTTSLLENKGKAAAKVTATPQVKKDNKRPLKGVLVKKKPKGASAPITKTTDEGKTVTPVSKSAKLIGREENEDDQPHAKKQKLH